MEARIPGQGCWIDRTRVVITHYPNFVVGGKIDIVKVDYLVTEGIRSNPEVGRVISRHRIDGAVGRWGSRHDHVVSLSYRDNDMVRGIRLDGNEIGADDLKHVVIDRKKERCPE